MSCLFLGERASHYMLAVVWCLMPAKMAMGCGAEQGTNKGPKIFGDMTYTNHPFIGVQLF